MSFSHARRSMRMSLRPLALFLGALAARAAHAQITRVEQTSGTTALLIGVHPVNDRVVWASGARGTWVRTTDGGTTWRAGRVPGADSVQFRDVYAIDSLTAWVLSIGDGPQSRVYHTTDGGATWALQFKNEDPRGFFDCFAFWDARRAVAIGDAIDSAMTMLRTTDGTQWTRVAPNALPKTTPGEGSFAASGTCAIARPGGRGWIVASHAGGGRVLRTSDYGARWDFSPIPLTTRTGSGPQSVAFRDDRHGMVLGGGNDAQTRDVLTATTADGGVTWTARTSPPLARGVWGGVYVPGARIPTVIAVGPSGAVVSRDEGRTWTAIDAMNYWSVGAVSPNAVWAVGTNGRITRLGGF